MIGILNKVLTITIICFGFTVAFSQVDSIITLEEEPDSIDIKYDRVFKLFVQQNNQEIKHLFKVNLVHIDLLTPNLTYEQKLGKNFSLETKLYVSYRNLVYRANDSTHFNTTMQLFGTDLQSLSIGGYQMIKFYYNFKRRELLDKNTNGFSGDYFAIRLSENYSWIDVFNQQERDDNTYLRNKYYLIPDIVYGIQRRIGNIGYIELSFALNYHENFSINNSDSWVLGLERGITLKMGFAIESVSKLKMMLRE